jgi:hypothetical protein
MSVFGPKSASQTVPNDTAGLPLVVTTQLSAPGETAVSPLEVDSTVTGASKVWLYCRSAPAVPVVGLWRMCNVRRNGTPVDGTNTLIVTSTEFWMPGESVG